MQQPDRIRQALRLIGSSEKYRNAFIDLCQRMESNLDYHSGSIRDDITGPLIDGIHVGGSVLRKRLASGLVFEFAYSSKIAREFVMSADPEPDHVWEPQTTKLLLHLSKQAQHVLVGGAYFGDQAILIAHALRSCGGVCHAFEPNAENCKMLVRNAAINQLSNMRLHNIGLWDDDKSRLHLVGEDALAFTEVATEPASDTLPTITIDTYVEREGLSRIDLIMVDVEGAEQRVFSGAAKQLSKPTGTAPHLVFEVHRHYVDWSKGLHNTKIIQFLRELGYTIFAVRDFQAHRSMPQQPIELIAPEDTYLEGPPHGFNMVAVKDRQVLQGSQFRMCKGVSPKLLVHKNPKLHHPVGGL